MKTQTKFKQTEIGMLPEEWEVEKIDNIYEISSGLSKPRNEFGFGHPFLTFKDIFDNFSLPKELHELVNSTEKERNTCSVMRGDVFLTRTSETVGELGMSSVALRNYENATFNGFAKRLRPKKKDVILPEFAVYLFRSNKVRTQIFAFSSLTTRASLTAPMIKEIKLMLPSLQEQTGISEILSSLDDKIELNRTMNVTLEKIGQALFKCWFIDFEFPNEKGKPYKSSGGKMVDSEVGEIPEGWKVDSILACADILSGGTPKTSVHKFWDGNIEWVSAKDITSAHGTYIMDTERKITKLGVESSNAKPLPPNTTVITARGTVGNYCLLAESMAINQTNYGIKGKQEYTDIFIFLTMGNLIQILKQHSYGTVFDTITTKNLEEMRIVIPPVDILKSFNDCLSPIMRKVKDNLYECRTLRSLRDSLLPRLMSGKIRVNNIGKFLEVSS